MAKKALIVWGGWDGHEPELVSARFDKILKEEGFKVDVSETLSSYDDPEKLKQYDLLVPVWTGGDLSGEQAVSVQQAIEEGTGMAGCHGGMCDSFRTNTEWQFLTGAQWVAHPGNDGTQYRVCMRPNTNHPIVEGIGDFDVVSEQYYILVDPCVNILATTRFPVAEGAYTANGAFDMPVMFTKLWGKGKLFYSSLGHHDDVFNIPEAFTTMKRGLLWATR